MEIKLNNYDKNKYADFLKLIKENKINTVCLEGDCPNRYKCFSSGTATFMILGDICTRNCHYCSIKKGVPLKLDKNEPHKIAEMVKKLKLEYIVITSVTRDDLKDGGANQFIQTVEEIRKEKKKSKIEVLIPDFKGNWSALEKIIKIKPEVINHNIETTKENFKKIRPEGDYKISLELLKKIKELDSRIITKSGFMVGLGETKKQITGLIKDLKKTNCDILTVGQYLQPDSQNFTVKKYYKNSEFEWIKKTAQKNGIKKVIAGTLVRSSYEAKKLI